MKKLSQAVVDYIGFPFSVPGNLEVRLARTLYLPDGSIIDQGTRSTKYQRGCHRFVVSHGESIIHRVDEQVVKGFTITGYRNIKKAAEIQWRPDVIESRITRLVTKGVVPRLHLRALGFDLVGAGELAIGLSKLTVIDGVPDVTAKANILVLPQDPIETLFSALDLFADKIGYERLPDEDKLLVRHMAAFVRRNSYVGEQPPTGRCMEQIQHWEAVPVDTIKENYSVH